MSKAAMSGCHVRAVLQLLAQGCLAQGCPGLAGDIGPPQCVPAEGRSGRGVGRLRQPLSRIRTLLQHFRQYRHHQAPRRKAVRLVSRTARLAGAHRGFSRRRRGAVRRCRRKGAGKRPPLRPRHRHRRDGLLDRDRDAEPGGARLRAGWASAPTSRACRCSASAAPAAPRACRSPRAWRRRGRAPTCCW